MGRNKNFHPEIRYLTIEREKVICVLTLSRNGVESIDQTILSVLSQAGEFLLPYHITDGGSTDGTLEYIEEWQARLESGGFPITGGDVALSTSTSDSGTFDVTKKGSSEGSDSGGCA